MSYMYHIAVIARRSGCCLSLLQCHALRANNISPSGVPCGAQHCQGAARHAPGLVLPAMQEGSTYVDHARILLSLSLAGGILVGSLTLGEWRPPSALCSLSIMLMHSTMTVPWSPLHTSQPLLVGKQFS